MKNWVLFTGGLMGLLSIIIGAAGKHVLGENSSTEMMSTFTTGLDFHKLHALVLVVLGISRWIITDKRSQRLTGWSAIFFIAGIFLFSFGMYFGVLTGNRSLFILNPFGGVSFMIGWSLILFWGFKGRQGE